jgi:hypothetical protein
LATKEESKGEKRTNLAPLCVGHDRLPRLTEDEGDDLEEELGDVDGLGTEVEDLTEDGGELREGRKIRTRCSWISQSTTYAGQAESEEVHAEGVDGEGAVEMDEVSATKWKRRCEEDERVILKGDTTSSDVLSGLRGGRKTKIGRRRPRTKVSR